MTPNASSFVLTGLGAAIAIASSLVEPRPILVWNATASTPRGLYCIAPLTDLQAGDLVLVQPDPASAALYAERADTLQQWHPEWEVTTLGIQRSARRIRLDQHKIACL